MLDLKKYTGEQLIGLYSEILQELKGRGIIRTRNLLGEFGEYIAESTYKQAKDLPTIKLVDAGVKNYDAISRSGERYSIKSTSSKGTGMFTGLVLDENHEPIEKYFDYVIICRFDEFFALKCIYELDWQMFLKHKHWNSTLNNLYLPINKALIADAKIILDRTKR